MKKILSVSLVAMLVGFPVVYAQNTETTTPMDNSNPDLNKTRPGTVTPESEMGEVGTDKSDLEKQEEKSTFPAEHGIDSTPSNVDSSLGTEEEEEE